MEKKQIQKDYSKKYYEQHKEVFKEYYQKNKDKIREKQKQYRDENKEEASAYYKKWYKENGRQRRKDYANKIKEWQLNNPEKVLASLLLKRAIKSGLINKPEQCSICMDKNRINGHHEKYQEPLIVIWVCNSCHKKIHNK